MSSEYRTSPPYGWYIGVSCVLGGEYLQGFNYEGHPVTGSYLSDTEVIAAMWRCKDYAESSRETQRRMEEIVEKVKTGELPVDTLLHELKKPQWKRPHNFREMVQILVNQIEFERLREPQEG